MGTPISISLVIWGPPPAPIRWRYRDPLSILGTPDRKHRAQDLDAIEALTKKCSRFFTAERGRSQATAGEEPRHKLGYSNVTYMRRKVHIRFDKSDLLVRKGWS